MRSAAVAVFLAVWPALAGAAEEPGDFDPDLYPAAAIDALLKKNPCRPGADGYEVKDILFSVQAVYDGALRSAGDRRRELVRRWAKSLKVEERAPLFSSELRVKAGPRHWWLPVAGSLAEEFKRDLKPGEEAIFYLSFVGCVDAEPVLAIEE